MSRETRGHRAGRMAGLGLLLATAVVAAWGLPIDAARVAALVDPEQPVRVGAANARIALRPLPTVVASDVRVSFEDRVRAELASVAIVLHLGSVLRGEPTWSRARVRGGQVVVQPASGEVPIRCAAMGGRVTAVGTTGARLDLHGDCEGRGVVLEGVRYRGDVDWRRRGVVRSAGRLTSGGPRLAGVAGTALAARVRTGPGSVRADDVRLAIGDGTMAGRGRWVRDATRRRVAIEFEGSGSAAEEAFEDAALRVAGRWVARGRGRAVVAAGMPLERRASGYGRVVLLEGSLEPFDVGGAVLDGLEVWRGRRRHRLRRRFPDVFGGERLRFDRAVVKVRARDGRYHLAPVRVRSRSYQADGEGRIGRDGRVRGEIGVVPSRPLSDALIGRGVLRAIVAGDRGEIVLPLEVTGRPGDLRVRPAPAFARQVLERALGGSALGRALDRLLDR